MGKAKCYDIVKDMISDIPYETKTFYYNKLELVDKTNICPICGEKIKGSIWEHAIIRVDTHTNFVKQQLKMCSELFFNLWFNKYNVPKDKMIKGFFISFKTSQKEYWGEWYDIKRPMRTNWVFIKENSYYNPNFTFDFNITICPICKETIRGSVFEHFSKALYRDDHQPILFQTVGAMLHNNLYKGNEYYPFDNYHYVLKKIHGTGFKVNKVAKIPEKRKILDREKAIKESYFAGKIQFEQKNGKCICPVCKNEFSSKRYVLTHIMQKFQDPEHYDLILQMYGDILSRDYYSNDCFCDEQTFYSIKNYQPKQNVFKEYVPFKKEFYNEKNK